MATNSQEKPAYGRVLAVVTLIAVALVVVGWMNDPDQFFRSYLVAWLFWVALSVGSMTLLLLHNLTGGAWGWAIRRTLLAAAGTMPLVAVLFVPIVIGMQKIYVWSDPLVVQNDPILQHKEPYLNWYDFVLRTGIYFLIWLSLAFFVRWQARRKSAPSEDQARRERVISGLGLGLSGLAVTFASVDWGMSLEPHWWSAIYGVQFMVSQGLAALAFGIVATVYWPKLNRVGQVASPQQLHDLGKLLLGFVMLWTYMAFSQFLIIWYGNLPEDNVWYIARIEHGWQILAFVIPVFHFMLPFCILLGREVKRNPNTLAAVALWILVMRWLDTVWLIEPAFKRDTYFIPWLDLALTVAIGGVWLALFAWQLPPEAMATAPSKKREVLAHG